uniref:Uncharacterized protein n=1 Tax=Amphiprion ocellaris TaxID=80972 RepID=A0AAQ5YI30_AMPOC
SGFPHQGDFVWVDSGAGILIGAEVKVTDTGQLRLIDDEGKEHKINKKSEGSIRPMHPTSVNGVDDMIRLGDLNEAGLLRNLLVRHKEGIIYTYTGSILVAVNPYQLLPIYTTDHVHTYTDRRLGELPPHVFALADACFFNMRRNKKNQCCVISGESGAGKTESTKLMLQFLAAVSGQHSWIEQQILEANPILEAFGNAKTVRNDNSSRFGKYIDINFTKGGAIEGARVDQYLLEKSRVCRQAPEERNYHVFYYMLMGMPAEQKKILSLGSAAEYKYLTMGNCTSCEGRDDVKEFAHFRAALKILMFTENDSWEICKLLAAILHLGNVDFEVNNLEGCEIHKSPHFDMACQLLEVDPTALDKSLTQRSFMTARESVIKGLTSAQALDGRDAFVKGIYGRLFIWVVDKINAAIYKPPENENEVRQSIGLLDIFGFENFNKNSFEQLCINFANEQLQQFFVKHVFKLEQEEYSRENIVWKHIDYQDNQRTLDVLAVKPLNMLSLIDEESSFPKGTDATMLQKMNQLHGKGDIYIPPKNNYEKQFGIQHFAGVVYYDSEGFLEKNRDTLSLDLIQLVETSGNKLLKQAFHNELSTGSNTIKSSVNPKMQASDNKKRVPTLVGQFRQSLDALMKALTACQPYFIRCIKPNDFKKPMLFDRELVMRQLRYSGMMETIRIRKAGYPVRYTFDEFLNRYRVLLKSSICDPKTVSYKTTFSTFPQLLLPRDWKTGKTKIFLKDFHDTMLELERIKELNQKALLIQKVMRGYKYRTQRQEVVQSGELLFLKINQLQAQVRSRQLHFQYKRKREAALVLQTQVRGYLARKDWKRKRDAVILQKHLEEVLRKKREEEEKAQSAAISAEDIVDDIFGFLPSIVGGQEGQAPVGFESLEGKKRIFEEIDIDDIPMEEDLSKDDYDDLDEYSFSKFASMYFQGAATPTHIRQRLLQPLLYHEDEGDVLASLTVWWIILRFMGDLPEPKKQVNVQAASRQERLMPQELISRTDRLSKTPTMQTVQEDADVMIGEGPTLDRPLTSLEKLHIIVGYAIVRRDLRDEIYCQICKQLQDNKNRNSYFRGWILLSLCLGVFPPTEPFQKYLQSFIRSAPRGYASYCATRLRRTVMNGMRGEPPSWLELQATKTLQPMIVTVTLLDRRSINIPVDSATTSREICQLLASKVRLKDTFGFSLYVALYEKVWALGSGREHVMDAISQCEQEVKKRGGQEQHAPWRLLLRKEIFTPWHNCKEDKISTDLIYRQVIHGLKFGEYQTEKEDDMVQLAAKHLYIQHGSDSHPDNVREAVQDCINNRLLEARSEAKWTQMISTAHAQVKKADSVKAEMVDYAREKWPIFFSRFFEVTKLSGPLSKSKFIVAINWTGITFLDEREKRLLELSFPEVTAVNTIREGKSSEQTVSLLTLKGDFTLTGSAVEDMSELITMFLSGLKERSQYAVALKDVDRQGWSPEFSSSHCHRLIVVIVYFVSEPPHTDSKPEEDNPLVRGTVISRNAAPERLWVSSREPIRQPLLKKLVGNSEFSPKYMGDYPTKQMQSPLELTDQIFGPATQHEALRDEIYCQIMKQMTSNNNRFSMEQGWQLLWLCCGLFPPSQALLKHAQRFLESRRRTPIASDCLQRLQSSLRYPRKFPPHQVEVDAIQQNSTQIFHKIHFPNDTDEIFEVSTSTRIRDLIQNISKKLHLASADGFSIFVKTHDKVLSLNDADYFFDSLRQITDWSKRAKRIKDGSGPLNISYLVFFMRKLWFNVIPGRDTEADLIFHFPQEMPKYLRGFHVCTKEDMINIAGLLFRVKVGSDKTQLVMIPKMIKDLVPADQLKAMSENEWKKSIAASYNKHAGMTVEEAQVAFLKAVCRWPTFGCAFFEVKQTSEQNFPDIVRISISKQGVTVINPKTKDVLATHPFNRIANWCSGSTYFHMTVGNLVKGNKFLCETSLGYKMDDLIASYVNMYNRERRAMQTRNQRFDM